MEPEIFPIAHPTALKPAKRDQPQPLISACNISWKVGSSICSEVIQYEAGGPATPLVLVVGELFFRFFHFSIFSGLDQYCAESMPISIMKIKYGCSDKAEQPIFMSK